MSFLDIQSIAVVIFGYPISYIELLGTSFGMISVFLASRGSILTWPTGIVNEFFLFLLFFQVQLYPDMALQIYFFVVTLFGWYSWRKRKNHRRITTLSGFQRGVLALFIVAGSVLAGVFFRNIHELIPVLFKEPSAYPFADSFILISSIAATYLLALKKTENWMLWILIDLAAVWLYLQKEIYFLALEYTLFLCIAIYGLIHWQKKSAND